jgi:hypothetical protein
MTAMSDRNIPSNECCAHWKARAEESEAILAHNMALANATTRRTMNERNSIIRTLRQRHSAIEIADMVGLTRQRVHQILNEAPIEVSVHGQQAESGRPTKAQHIRAALWRFKAAIGLGDSQAQLSDRVESIVELACAPETNCKPARDADHCDYPDCEQHWTYVATEQRKLLSEARAYVLSFASITKHPTAPADAHDLVKRMDAWIKNSPPAVDFRAAPPPSSQKKAEAMRETTEKHLCEDCPPAEYPTDKTRCAECPRRSQKKTGDVSRRD